MTRVDLHSHTHYSPDCRMSFETVAGACRRARIDVLATTDHNTAEGALAFQRWCKEHAQPLTIIVGEEILTRQGEVIGLYLNETIPMMLPLGETIDRIHAQAGLFLLEHPFDPLRHGLDEGSWAVSPDIVEVFNARTRLKASNDRALELQRKKGVPACACSDAHTASEFGSAYTETPPFDATEPKELVRALAAGRPVGSTSPPWVSMHSMFARLLHKLGR